LHPPTIISIHLRMRQLTRICMIPLTNFSRNSNLLLFPGCKSAVGANHQLSLISVDHHTTEADSRKIHRHSTKCSKLMVTNR